MKTTGWVLSDEIEGFPLLLHARVLPRRAAPSRNGWADGPDYTRYWNSSKRIGAFIGARAVATEDLCIVLEHVPHTMHEWLLDHQAAAPALLGQLCSSALVARRH